MNNTASTAVDDGQGEFVPPRHPPPLLDENDLEQLMEHGFVGIKLPPKLAAVCKSLDAATESFFAHDEQLKQRAYPAAHATELGYYVVEGEKEYVTLRSSTNNKDAAPAAEAANDEATLAGLRRQLEEPAAELWKTAAALMYRVLIQISDALEIPHDAWTAVLDGTMTLPAAWAHATPSLLRLFRYEPEQGIAGRHVDNGLLTLCVGTGAGLQVWRAADEMGAAPDAGAWEDATGPTLLLGGALKVLCAARVAAGAHQVVANPRGRRSIVFAWRPCTRHTLDLVPFGGQGVWSLDEMWRRITSQRVNVNAKLALREEQTARREKWLADRGSRDMAHKGIA